MRTVIVVMGVVLAAVGIVAVYPCRTPCQVNWETGEGSDCDVGPSPLVLDLGDDGVVFGDVGEGVRFDLFGDGHPVRCAWPRRLGDAWLAFDRDGDGEIRSARELFGSVSGGRPYADGFQALASLDTDRNGLVSALDIEFDSLRLWEDLNRDGTGTADELRSLGSAGIVALETIPTVIEDGLATDPRGNRFPLVARFFRVDGRAGDLVDVFPRWTVDHEANP